MIGYAYKNNNNKNVKIKEEIQKPKRRIVYNDLS